MKTMYRQSYLTDFCFLAGEGVVSEQEDEVEACEGRPAGGSSTGERTGECKKGEATAIRAVRGCGTSVLGRFAEAGDRGG